MYNYITDDQPQVTSANLRLETPANMCTSCGHEKEQCGSWNAMMNTRWRTLITNLHAPFILRVLTSFFSHSLHIPNQKPKQWDDQVRGSEQIINHGSPTTPTHPGLNGRQVRKLHLQTGRVPSPPRRRSHPPPNQNSQRHHQATRCPSGGHSNRHPTDQQRQRRRWPHRRLNSKRRRHRRHRHRFYRRSSASHLDLPQLLQPGRSTDGWQAQRQGVVWWCQGRGPA